MRIQWGPKFVCFTWSFLVNEGRGDPNTTKSRPSLAHHPNAIQMAFGWRADDGPTLNAGLVAFVNFRGIWVSIAKKPCSYVINQGGRKSGTPFPPLDPRIISAHAAIIISKVNYNLASLFFFFYNLWSGSGEIND